jgi:hypothetical protein
MIIDAARVIIEDILRLFGISATLEAVLEVVLGFKD